MPDLFVFDFDGTLAHRPGLWSQCLLDVLDQHLPGHGATLQDLRLHLRDGFPWHRAEVAHPELSEPDNWWAAIGETIDRAYLAVGIDATATETLRPAVRAHYCDPTRFELYPDTLEALAKIRDVGARSVILSNHVPELVDIVHYLGLGPLACGLLSCGTRTPRFPMSSMPSSTPSATGSDGVDLIRKPRTSVDVALEFAVRDFRLSVWRRRATSRLFGGLLSRGRRREGRRAEDGDTTRVRRG